MEVSSMYTGAKVIAKHDIVANPTLETIKKGTQGVVKSVVDSFFNGELVVVEFKGCNNRLIGCRNHELEEVY